MEKRKIYYNNEGWVCNRYPNDFPVDDENKYIEVDEKMEEQTLYATAGYAWRVVNGELKQELYDTAEAQKQEKEQRISELKAELASIKEDIEQEAFGLLRDEYVEKKAPASQIINELRVLEGKEPRKVVV